VKADFFIGTKEGAWTTFLVPRRFHWAWLSSGGRVVRDALPEDGTTEKRCESLSRTRKRFSASLTANVIQAPAAVVASPTAVEAPPAKKRRGRPKGSKTKRGSAGGETKIKERVT